MYIQCILYHSSIFKAITNDIGNPQLSINNSIKGLFNGNSYKKHSVLSNNDIFALKAYNAELKKVIGYEVADGKIKPIYTSVQTAFNRTMRDASIEAQNMAISANGMKVNLEQIPKVSQAATLGIKAFALAGNLLFSMGIGLAIQGIISGINYFIHKEDELKKKTKELSVEFSNTTSDIDSYKNKINELKQVINNSSSSYKEVTDARRELLGIQEELIEKYGSETESIHSITEAINGETNALNNLKTAEWYNTKKEYNKTDWKENVEYGAKQAITNPFGLTTFFSDLFQLTGLTDESLIKNTNTHLEDVLYKWNNQEINLPKSGNKNVDNLMDVLLTKGSTDWLSGDFTKGYDGFGSVSVLKDKLGQIKAYATTQNNVDENFVNKLQSALNYLQEIYEQDYQIVSNAVLYDKIKSDDVNNTYDHELNKLEIIKSQYDDALLTADEKKINQYAQQYTTALNAAMELAINNGDNDVSEYYYDLFPTMKDVVNKTNLKNQLSSDSSLQKDSQLLNDFNKDDILTFLTSKEQEKGEKAFKTIRDKAIEDGVILNNSIEESKRLIDLLVEWGILKNKATEFNDDILSITSATPKTFQEAWNNLGTTGTDDEKQAALEAKQELQELAKAGEISDTTLNSNENYKTLLEDTGLSAREARHEIMKMISEQEKMSGFQSQMDNMATLYNEFKDKGFVTAETLNGLPDVFKDMNGGTDFDLFSKIVGDPKSGTQKIKKAFNDIVTAYIKDQDILTGTTTDTKGTVIANLEDAGISNAKKIVNAYIDSMNQINAAEDEFFNQSDEQRAMDITNFQNALKDKNTSFSEACNILGTNNGALIYTLGEQYANDYTNWLELIDKKKEAYNTYVQALNNASPENVAEQAKKGSEGASPSSIYMGLQSAYNSYKNISEEEEDAKNKITGYQTINLDFDPLEYKPKEPDTNDKNQTKETKHSFDWLERKVSVLTSKLDLLKAKIENVFSVRKKNSIINDEIKNTNALIKTYKQQAKIYKAQAKKSAKSEETVTGNDKAKLTGKKGKKLKKQIQTGQIKGSKKQWIQKYGESTANAIEEYQSYWDKYQEAHVNIQSAKTSKRQLKIQKHQNKADKFDARSDKYDAQIENAKTAKDKNDLEDKKIKSTKKNYKQQIKIAKLEYGKNSPQVAKLKAEKKTAVRDIKIEKQQNLQDEADAQRDLLDAKIESAQTVSDKNNYLQQQQAYITSSYNAQIKIANLEGNTAKKEELKIKKEKELLENEKQQLQNLSDEQSALYELNQLRESNAKSAKEKNKCEADSRKNLKAQYSYEIEIAKKNGDTTEADRLQLELNEKIEESYQRQIENLKEEYDLTIGLNDAKKSTIDSQIAALQANGYNVAAELYKKQQGIALENYQNTLSKISAITTEMQNLDPESQAYQNYLIELESYKQEAWGYQQAWAEAQQAINDINLSKIEHVGTLLGYQSNQLEHIQNILGHSDFTLSAKDGGGLTMEGLSGVAITFQQIQNNNDLIANKSDQMAEIQRQIDNKEYVGSQEQAEEEIYNLLREIEELEEANYDFGESIKTLVIDSLNSLSNALDENISKCKDTLKVQKDLFDYRKKVVNQLKSIASLEKQLAALENSDTEEARARIQKLQIQLEEEQENLNEIEYDKYIQDQEEMLDKVSEDFQDFIANVADASVAKICEAMSKVVTDNLDKISKTITNSFVDSASVGAVADSITDLKNVMENIDFNTKITLNINSNGVPTSMNIDGKEVTVPKQDNGMSGTANDIENGNPDGNATLKQSIEKYLNTLSNYVSDTDSGMSLSIDPLNQFLYTEHGKMATSFQKFQILKRLDLIQNGWGDEINREILWQAVKKLQHLGFSRGGIATQLNRIALANGDDGWATLKRGESVLTPAQTEQFQKLTENLVPLNTIAETIPSLSANPASVNHSSAATTTTIRNVDIHLDGSHVMDADSFIQTLHNPRVLQEVSSGISSQLGSVLSNKLGTF